MNDRTTFASWSRHIRQNEYARNRVLGTLSVPEHSGHSASFLRLKQPLNIPVCL